MHAAANNHVAKQVNLPYKKVHGSKQRRTIMGAAGVEIEKKREEIKLSPVRKQLGGDGKRLQPRSPVENSKRPEHFTQKMDKSTTPANHLNTQKMLSDSDTLLARSLFTKDIEMSSFVGAI